MPINSIQTIKFKVWDKTDQKMFSWEDIKNMRMEIGEGYEVGLPISEIENNKTFDWLQYTGLHDKNGKEIYEGDILDHAYGKHSVVWNTYRWELSDGHAILWSNRCEVIGNIYENPELLTEAT